MRCPDFWGAFRVNLVSILFQFMGREFNDIIIISPMNCSIHHYIVLSFSHVSCVIKEMCSFQLTCILLVLFLSGEEDGFSHCVCDNESPSHS